MVITRRCCHIRKASQFSFVGVSGGIQPLAMFAKNCRMWVDRNALDEATTVGKLKVIFVGDFFCLRRVASSAVTNDG